MKSKLLPLLLIIIVISNGCLTSKVTDTNDKISQIINLEVDKLGNYYTIDVKDNIEKFTSNNTLLFSYSNSNYGSLAMLDVTNPHKLLLFYEEQQIIVILDNTLAEIGLLELKNTSHYTAAGFANDGNIWLYDSFLFKLIKIDNMGIEIDESFPINKISPQHIQGSKILDRGNYVFIIDQKKGVLIYNNMGYYEKLLPIVNILKPTIISNKIYYFNKQENLYQSYDLRFNETAVLYNLKRNQITPTLLIYKNNYFYYLENNFVNIINENEFHKVSVKMYK